MHKGIKLERERERYGVLEIDAPPCNGTRDDLHISYDTRVALASPSSRNNPVVTTPYFISN